MSGYVHGATQPHEARLAIAQEMDRLNQRARTLTRENNALKDQVRDLERRLARASRHAEEAERRAGSADRARERRLMAADQALSDLSINRLTRKQLTTRLGDARGHGRLLAATREVTQWDAHRRKERRTAS